MQKNFVTFYSPGTFIAETTTLPVSEWSVEEALKLADTVIERHGATPFAFRFIIRSREENELDSKISASSNLYFLGGKVEALDEIRNRKDPKDDILISNMEINGWDRVVTNSNSYRWTQPLEENDSIIDYTPPSKREQI